MRLQWAGRVAVMGETCIQSFDGETSWKMVTWMTKKEMRE
jgi:hypothetical protein